MSALAKQAGRLEISQSRGLMAVSLGRSEHALPDWVLVLRTARKRWYYLNSGCGFRCRTPYNVNLVRRVWIGPLIVLMILTCTASGSTQRAMQRYQFTPAGDRPPTKLQPVAGFACHKRDREDAQSTKPAGFF